jgi:hypothetical protein
MHPVPINLIAMTYGKQLEEAHGRVAAIERDQEAIPFADGFGGLHSEKICHSTAQILYIIEDANFGFHTCAEAMC